MNLYTEFLSYLLHICVLYICLVLLNHIFVFSAGVGRTGTYITLDTMLERMQDVDSVTVYDCVRNLRARRVFMVQTQVTPVVNTNYIVYVYYKLKFATGPS